MKCLFTYVGLNPVRKVAVTVDDDDDWILAIGDIVGKLL